MKVKTYGPVSPPCRATTAEIRGNDDQMRIPCFDKVFVGQRVVGHREGGGGHKAQQRNLKPAILCKSAPRRPWCRKGGVPMRSLYKPLLA